MSETVVEVIYGKYSKYEVVKKSDVMSSNIVLRKDGKYISSHSSVEAAVEAANRKG